MIGSNAAYSTRAAALPGWIPHPLVRAGGNNPPKCRDRARGGR